MQLTKKTTINITTATEWHFINIVD